MVFKFGQVLHRFANLRISVTILKLCRQTLVPAIISLSTGTLPIKLRFMTPCLAFPKRFEVAQLFFVIGHTVSICKGKYKVL